MENDEGEKYARILDGHIPCPEGLRDITSTFTYAPDEIPQKWKDYLANGEWTQEDYDDRVARNNENRQKQDEAVAEYGYKDWYDWQIGEWGVKWGDCDTEFHTKPTPYYHKSLWMTSATFQTPWGVGVAGFIKLSKKFPNCLFMLDSDEEAGFFQGIEMMHGGEVVFEDYFEPCNYSPPTSEGMDWEDEDQVLMYEDWKLDQHHAIEKNVETYLRNRDWLPQPVIPDKPKEAVKAGKPQWWR